MARGWTCSIIVAVVVVCLAPLGLGMLVMNEMSMTADDLAPARNKEPDSPVRYHGCKESTSWREFTADYPLLLPPDTRNVNYCVDTGFHSEAAYLRFEADEEGVRKLLVQIRAGEERTVVYAGRPDSDFHRFVPGDLVPGRSYGSVSGDPDEAAFGPGVGIDVLIDRSSGTPMVIITIFGP